LLGSVPRLDRPIGAKLTPIEGMPPDLIDDPAGCAFAPRCAYCVERSLQETPPLAPATGVDPAAPYPHAVACWVDVRTARPDPGRLRAAAEIAAVPPGAIEAAGGS
jgi:oligopeptide/dipeptide ABC transporter ATP-binding protein